VQRPSVSVAAPAIDVQAGIEYESTNLHFSIEHYAVHYAGTRDLGASGPVIIIKEGFFKPDLCNLIAKGTQAYQWRYNHKSDIDNPTHNKFFVSHLWNEESQENFFYILWRMIHKDIPFVGDCYCWRIIANGQVKGQNGNWHTDHGDKTVLYFPLEWVPEWGGSTYFKIDEAETQIQYKRNQILAFDSHILHYGSSPAVDNILRVSIAFNLRINKLDETKVVS
jgi:hypothetical protein